MYKIINDEVTTKSDARRKVGDPSDIDFNEITKSLVTESKEEQKNGLLD